MSLLSRTRFGLLDLHFVVRRGKTVLLRDVQKAPLMIVRPFTLPCGTLMVFIVNPTGGVLGGDHSEIRVQVDSGARVLLLTQSATRLQPSHSGEVATQDIHFTVQDGARLEYYPERTIPFARSRFHQTLQAELEDGAEFGLTESLAAGRVLMGERLQFDEYRSVTSILRQGSRLYLDRQYLAPAADSVLEAPGIWGGLSYFASGVWVAPRASNPPLLPTAFPGRCAAGWSQGQALWLRAVAVNSGELDARLLSARDQVRRHLFRAEPLRVRK